MRPFLLDDPDSTLQVMQSWTASPSEHIRRLASEGSRPVLPWGIKLPALQADPARTREILQALRHDDARYVQRSVANHMNDHSRAHPEYVLGRFPEGEAEAVDHALGRAASAVRIWAEQGLARAMEEANRRDLDPGPDRP